MLGTGQHATYSTNTNPSAAAAECTSVSGTLSKRPPNHSLKSFSVPAPPCQSAPTTPQPRHIGKTEVLLKNLNKRNISCVLHMTWAKLKIYIKLHGYFQLYFSGMCWDSLSMAQLAASNMAANKNAHFKVILDLYFFSKAHTMRITIFGSFYKGYLYLVGFKSFCIKFIN